MITYQKANDTQQTENMYLQPLLTGLPNDKNPDNA